MLCWNVYCGNFNAREIKVYNVFDHFGFYNACVKAKKKFRDDKEGFAEEVRSNLMYYFWSKCEWEILLDRWPDGEWSALRTTMKIRDMVDMYRSAGQKCDGWMISENVMDRNVTLRAYPEWNDGRREKIDVYEQVHNNWEPFIDYLWEHRKELKARKL